LSAIQPLRVNAAIIGNAAAEGAVLNSAAASNDDFNHLATELEGLDVLAGAFDRFHTKLRSGFIADGTAAPKPGDPVPADFVPFRAGFLRSRRMRLVDGYGQVVDLVGSGENQLADVEASLKAEP